MLISKKALGRLVREAIEGNRIISERPWSVEYTFSLKPSDKSAEDSEGSSADGFSITMTSESGTSMKILVDSYWNPQNGDKSGNSIKVELADGEMQESYVPHKFDDGSYQKIFVSNTPVSGMLSIGHSLDEESPPIIYLAVPNPFDDDDDITFDVEPMGNGKVDVTLTNHTNV